MGFILEILPYILFLALVIAFILSHSNSEKRAANLGIKTFSKATYISGIGDFNQGIDVNIFCYEDKIGFDSTGYGKRDITLTLKADLLKQAKLTDKKNKEQGLISNETSKYEDNYQLPYKRIKRVDLKSTQQITEKQKSILTSSIAGGVLAGGVGAVLGGMTGLKNEKEQSTIQLLSIDYTTRNSEEKTALFAMKPINNKDLQGFREMISFIMRKIDQDVNGKITSTQEL